MNKRIGRAAAWVLAAALAVSGAAWCSTDIDPAARHGWSQNTGWANAYADGTNGVVVTPSVLSGYVWLQNAGWLCLGDGTPDTPPYYSNASASDFGVNNDGSGNLSGYAWGQNIGWVNFNTLAQGGSRVTINPATGQFSGYAWGQNIGWINMSSGYGVRVADDTAPTVSLTTVVFDPTNQSPFLVVATFSEPVTGFTAAGVQVTNGSVSGFSGSGAEYTFFVTPAGPGVVTVTVPAGACTDLSSNPNEPAAPLPRTYDTVRPGVTLGSLSPGLVNGLILVTASLTEPCPDFDVPDIMTENAAVLGFTGSGTEYVFALTPNTDGPFSCMVPQHAIHDLAGNSSMASNTISRTYDGTPPAAVLTSTAGARMNGPITVNVTLSEPCTDFAAGDLVLDNAGVTGFGGSGTAYSFTLAPIAEGAFSCYVDAGTITDAAGNPNFGPSNVLGRECDLTPPGIVLSCAPPEVMNQPYAEVSVTLSEPCLGFEQSDLVLANATITAFTGSGEAYAFRLIPSGQGVFTCMVNAGACTDLAGNPNLASNTLSRTLDTVPPTATLSSTDTSPANGAITVQVTLSEPSLDFGMDDITGQNGAVASDFSGSGASYTFTLTPASPGGQFGCLVMADRFTDSAGNRNTQASNELVYFHDTEPPSVSLTSTAPESVNGAITVQALLSDTSTDFAAENVTTSNAAVSNFTGSGTSYSFLLTPSAPGVFTCKVIAGAFTDVAGNASTADSNTISRTYDAAVPSVTLSSTAPDPTRTAPIPVTVTFSKPVTGFEAVDVLVMNADVTGFSGSGANYSFTLAPAGQGLVRASIPANAAQDAAGNGNAASQVLTRVYDSASPTVTLDSAAGNPTRVSPIPVTVTFNEPVTGFAAGHITPSNGSVANFAGSGAAYTFDLIPSGQGAVTASVAAGVVQDAAGNSNVASAVLSRTYDSVNPAVTMTSSTGDPTSTYPIPLVVTFNEPVSGFVSSDVTVTNGYVLLESSTETTYTFSLIPAGAGLVTANIAAGAAYDAAGNGNTAAAQFSRTYSPPSNPAVVFSTTSPNPTNTPLISFTATFSANVTGFTQTDLVPTNATVTNFTGSGAVYTFDLVPLAEGLVKAWIAAGACQDGSMRGNLEAWTGWFSYDITGPYVDPTPVRAPGVAQRSHQVVEWEIRFLGDMQVTGVDSTDFSLTPSGNVVGAHIVSVTSEYIERPGYFYTHAWISVDTGSGDGSIQLHLIDDDSIQDLAGNPLKGQGIGNPNGNWSSNAHIVDKTGPAITLMSESGPVASSAGFRVRVISPEEIKGLTIEDVLVTNGTITSMGAIFSVMPSAAGEVTVQIPAGVAEDIAGNVNTASNVLVRPADLLPGTAGAVVSDAGPATANNNSLSFHWTGFTDQYSPIAEYEVAFGTADNPEAYQAFTPQGTFMLADINPGIDPSMLLDYIELPGLRAVESQVFFGATDGSAYWALYKTDGTKPGTVMLKEIVPDFSTMQGIGSTAYFTANDFVYGSELWKSDGSGTGTVMVADLTPGAESSVIGNLRAAGSSIFFTFSQSASGNELWKSNGTATGTVLVKDIFPDSSSSSPGMVASMGGILYFAANDGTSGREMWRSDGSGPGTFLVADINPGAGGAVFYTESAVIGNLLYFIADTGAGPALWRTDGTTAGTVQVYGGLTNYWSLTASTDRLFFRGHDAAHGSELWTSDGTPAGTQLVKDITPGPDSTISSAGLVCMNGLAYFCVRNNWGTQELWKSDGTTGGTARVAYFDYAYDAYDLTVLGTAVYLSCSNPTFGLELWRSDGTEAGTYLVKDIRPGNMGALFDYNWNYSNYPIIAGPGAIYMGADDGVRGCEPWRSGPAPADITLRPSMFPASFPGGVFPEGTYVCTVRAIDAAGMTTPSASGFVTVHLDAPTCDEIVSQVGQRTNRTAVTFAATFSEAVQNVNNAADVVVHTTGTVAYTGVSISGGPVKFVVNVLGVSGDGTLSIEARTTSDIADMLGTPLASSVVSEVVTVDNTPPHTLAVITYEPNPTNATSVQFLATHSEYLTGMKQDPANAVILTTGTVAYTGVEIVGGPGTHGINISGLTGDGTLSVTISTSRSAQDFAGNPLASSVTSAPLTLKHSGPAVTANTAAVPGPINTGTVSFTTTFSENVQGFNNADDVTVVTTGTVANTGVTISGGPLTYSVQASGVTGTGTIAVAPSLASDIRDMLGNPLAATMTSSSTLVDNAAPTVTSITPSTSGPVNSTEVAFLVVFSEDVYNVGQNNDFVITAAGTVTFGDVVVFGGPRVYQVYVTTVAGNGTLTLAVSTVSDVKDIMNYALASSPASDPVTIDNMAPATTASLITPTPTGDDVIEFLVTFSEPVVPTFTAACVQVTGTLTGTVDVVVDDDPNYIVTVALDDPDADGTVAISVLPHAFDHAGNACASATSALCTVHNWPGFTQEPASARKYLDDDHTFVVEVDPAAATATYQWKWKDADGMEHSGPTAATWSLEHLTAADRGEYWCEVTFEGWTYPSRRAALDVKSRVNIVIPPEGGTKPAHTSHTFHVVAEGGYAPLYYLWLQDGDIVAEGPEPLYIIDDLRADHTGVYVVHIMDDNGDLTESDPVELLVMQGVPASGPVTLALLGIAMGVAGLALVRKRKR